MKIMVNGHMGFQQLIEHCGMGKFRLPIKKI